MKLINIVNLIFIRFKFQKRIIDFIINNVDNNNILYRDFIKQLLNFKVNNLINVENNKFL